jgi:hypothetical protein
MATIDVSREQRAFLRALRDELQDEVQYGSVREQDALQYLIDHFEGGGDIDVDAEIEVDDEAIEAAKEEESATADGGAVTEPPADDAGATVDASTTDAAGGDVGDGDVGDGDVGDGDIGDGDVSGGESGGDDDRLNEMMNLLDTHDDKWREADSQDARYEVDLPDGTTEQVQTKDDVRAHIFKNYD